MGDALSDVGQLCQICFLFCRTNPGNTEQHARGFTVGEVFLQVYRVQKHLQLTSTDPPTDEAIPGVVR